jgi:hypothetical protein
MPSFLAAIDWCTALGMPPRRRFTAAELVRAQAASISPTVITSVVLNLALPVSLVIALFFDEAHWPLVLLMVAFCCGLVAAGVHAWRDPSSTMARRLYWLLPLGTAFAVGLMHRTAPYPRHALMVVWGEVMIGTLALWFCIVHRHHYIEARLRELDERERAIEMARRLAAAQIEPHFLFNTLASLQHWVDSGDRRAAPFLHSLTGYLRATLPMFALPLQPLAAELTAVQRYLEVMQLRLGDRLSWRVDVPEAMLASRLPPGTLLTLVENAVEHGVEPQLRGGELRVNGKSDGTRHELRVTDNGPGPAGGSSDGQGLANVRERLRLAFGDAARLELTRGAAGGCEARLSWTEPR